MTPWKHGVSSFLERTAVLKKTIEYENPFTGEMQKKDFYFHISKGTLTRLALEYDGAGGLEAWLREILDKKDARTLMDTLERIILMSCGERSGDTFDQSPEAVARFRNSPAYSELFTELCTNAESAAEFIAGAIPKNLQKHMPTNPLETVELPHPLQTETAYQPPATPEFSLGPVEDNAVHPKTAEELLGMDGRELTNLIEDRTEVGTQVRTVLVEMSNDQFKTIVRKFQGGNMPKVLTAMAFNRL